MDDILSTLSVTELERIMGVMNRDKQLRERERERVTRLGIELVREKRLGALVVSDNQKLNAKFRCARCLTPLPTIAHLKRSKWRCCVCNHLVCKSCRVARKPKAEVDSFSAKVEPVVDFSSQLRNASAAADNLLPRDDQQDADVSSLPSQTDSSTSSSEFISSRVPKEHDNLRSKDFRFSDFERKTSVFPITQRRINKDVSRSIGDYDSLKTNVSNESLKSISDISELSPIENLNNISKAKKLIKNDIMDDIETRQKKDNKANIQPEEMLILHRKLLENTGVSDGGNDPEPRGNSNIVHDGDREVMARFLKMAGVNISSKSLSEASSIHQTAAATPTKRSLEEKILTSTPVKALTMLSRSPLQIASDLFVHQPREANNSLSIIIKKRFLDSGLDDSLLSKSTNNLAEHSKISSASDNQFKTDRKLTPKPSINCNKTDMDIHSASLNSESFKLSCNVIGSLHQTPHMTAELIKFSKRFGLRSYEVQFPTTESDTSVSDSSQNDSLSNEGNASDIETDTSISVSSLLLLSKQNSKQIVRLKTNQTTRSREMARKRRRLKKLKAKQLFTTPHQESLVAFEDNLNATQETTQKLQYNQNKNRRNAHVLCNMESRTNGDRYRSDSKHLLGRGFSAPSALLTTVGDLTKNLLDENKNLWICRVCQKTIELHKKTGEWFHKATTPTALSLKLSLFESSSSPGRSRSSTLAGEIECDSNVIGTMSRSRSLSTLVPTAFHRNSMDVLDTSSLNVSSAARGHLRPRSQTLQPQSHPIDEQVLGRRSSKKMNKMTISEVTLTSLKRCLSGDLFDALKQSQFP